MSGPRIGAGGVYEWGDNATASKWTLQYQSAVIGEDVDVALANDRISGISLWHFYDFKVDNCGSTWPCHGRPGQERAAPSAHKTHLVTRVFVSMADFRRRTAPTAPTTTRRPPPSRSSAGSARQTAPPSRQPSGPEVQTARACSPFLLLVHRLLFCLGTNHKGVLDFWRRPKPAFAMVAAKYRAARGRPTGTASASAIIVQ